LETHTIDRLEENKQMVRDFYQTAFNLHKPGEAAAKYLGTVYRQHNPTAEDGPEAFIKLVTEYESANPEMKIEIKRIIAEGDLVVTHSRLALNSYDLGTTVADIFRIENGKIVEHWDDVQPIPVKSANVNTMF
jgi:predicted SnoaL-like aldol condensation-catalyzing enzyme